MQYLTTGRRFCGNESFERTFVERYGDSIWETLCDTMSPHEPFTVKEAARRLHHPQLDGLAQNTRRTRVMLILHNVMAQPAPCLRKDGHWYHWV